MCSCNHPAEPKVERKCEASGNETRVSLMPLLILDYSCPHEVLYSITGRCRIGVCDAFMQTGWSSPSLRQVMYRICHLWVCLLPNLWDFKPLPVRFSKVPPASIRLCERIDNLATARWSVNIEWRLREVSQMCSNAFDGLGIVWSPPCCIEIVGQCE